MRKYCENYAVNAVLSSLINRAAGEGIEVDCEAFIPENVAIGSMELGLVFANAIENAINACCKLNNPAGKIIKVTCREHCGQLYIRISNPYEGEMRFEGEFPVSQCKEHGVLVNVTISGSVTSIGEDAFAFCVSLTCVAIPDSVTSIGEKAFYAVTA
jgi:hypothetical protein